MKGAECRQRMHPEFLREPLLHRHSGIPCECHHEDILRCDSVLTYQMSYTLRKHQGLAAPRTCNAQAHPMAHDC